MTSLKITFLEDFWKVIIQARINLHERAKPSFSPCLIKWENFFLYILLKLTYEN
jgi:hypothetical protein